jgi:asparagine synthase (glutamine-hydrolysing)
MCGIAGLSNLTSETQLDPAVVQRMARQLSHRGPDDEGFHAEAEVAFGFRRLSIIDVAGGHQPVPNEDQTIWCMLNGEIYNYKELRDRLRQQGHEFKTNGDTETIVHAYEQHGLDFVEELRGMFAIALWDGQQRRLILARDRIGKKPLFYSIYGGQLAFASELKAFLAWPGLDRALDYAALQDYFRYLYVPAPRTVFSSVRKLLPGHLLIADTARGTWHTSRYWRPQMEADRQSSGAQLADGLRDRLEEAVTLRLRSDVPLGTFLSGGLDSSAITALARKANGSIGDLMSFSVGFHERAYDESAYAAQMAQHVGTRHRQLTAEPISQELLRKIVWHLDEPFADSSAIPTYLLCRAARQHVTVALSGDGGDELFAGYDRYRHLRWLSLINALPPELKRFIENSLRLAGRVCRSVGQAGPERARQLAKAIECARCSTARQPFALNQYFERNTLDRLFRPELRDAMEGHALEDDFLPPFGQLAGKDPLEWFLHVDLLLSLPDQMLAKVDRMSMATGLEVRCPLLDQSVVEYASRIPASQKLNGRCAKYILKKATSDLLPARILRRRKQGFSVPLGSWLETEFKEMVQEVLSPSAVERRGVFDPVALQRELSLAAVPVRDQPFGLSAHQRQHRLWSVIAFELWAQQFLDSALAQPARI